MTEQISDTLTKITLEDKEIYLIGTAHVSSDSVQEVEQFIKNEAPDTVCLELDEGRYKTMTEGQSWNNVNIHSILKQGKGFFFLASLALSSFQKRMGIQTGVTPGEEMKAAAQAAKEAGVPIALCDRDIQITLRRAWGRSSFWNKLKMLGLLVSAAFSREELSSDDIEALKERGALGNMMEELAKELPSAKKVLIDERDQYLATKIYQTKGKKIVAAVGAGHATGIADTIGELSSGNKNEDLSALELAPKRKRVGKVLPWLVPLAVAALFAYGFINSGWDQGLRMFFYWFVVNGVLSGIGAILALAHPLTIILSVLLAPFTSLNPTIGVGIVSGTIEAYMRKPRVSDFEHLSEDTLSIKGFYRNRFTHALVVFFLTSIGSAIGTFAAFPFLASLLR
ncbi:MAG: TraB/GumN family protein [Spirochaetota bacterium]